MQKTILLILSCCFITNLCTMGELIDSALDGLNFNHSRGVTLALETSPVEIHYKAAWKYRGAGDRTQPFAGINGRLDINLNYDGFSFQIRRSQSLKHLLQDILRHIEQISPCNEFYFKMMQLAWSVGQQKNPDALHIQHALETLVARLKLTPGGDQCTFYSMPIISSPNRPGLDAYLTQSPEQCTAQFIILSQKASALMGLLTGRVPFNEQAAYLQTLLSHINYYDASCTLLFPGNQVLTLTFDAQGSGNSEEPLQRSTITLLMPATATVEYATEWQITLSPEQTGLLRVLMLFIHHRRQPLSWHTINQEIGTLATRLSITPLADGEPSAVRALLGLICHYHRSIINYSFDTEITAPLSSSELCVQLCRIAYHAFLMTHATPHDFTHFITLHTAQALRWYQGTIALKHLLHQKAQIPSLSSQGIIIDWQLFIHTLIKPTVIAK